MECRQCLKKLNEMSIVCDRCGTKIKDQQEKLDFDKLNIKIIQKDYEGDFSKNFIKEIKKAYYLSNIRKDLSGMKKKYATQFIDYVLLKTYYVRNKHYMMTKDYDDVKALEIYRTFLDTRCSRKMKQYLIEFYGDDYKNHKIPKNITKGIPKIYLPIFDVKEIKGTRIKISRLITFLFHTIKGAIPITGILLALQFHSRFMTEIPEITQVIDMVPYYMYIAIGLGLFKGMFKGFKYAQKVLFRQFFEYDQDFVKTFNRSIKKRVKALEKKVKKGKKDDEKK